MSDRDKLTVDLMVDCRRLVAEVAAMTLRINEHLDTISNLQERNELLEDVNRKRLANAEEGE